MLFQPILILALDIMNFLSWQNYWGGGGGGQNDMFAPPPPIFSWGGGATAPLPPPPPPQDRRLCTKMPYLPRASHESPQIPKMAIRGSYEVALRKGVTTALEHGKNPFKLYDKEFNFCWLCFYAY